MLVFMGVGRYYIGRYVYGYVHIRNCVALRSTVASR